MKKRVCILQRANYRIKKNKKIKKPQVTFLFKKVFFLKSLSIFFLKKKKEKEKKRVFYVLIKNKK